MTRGIACIVTLACVACVLATATRAQAIVVGTANIVAGGNGGKIIRATSQADRVPSPAPVITSRG